jgi:site-specific DNA-methyltransferase (adenine-specific)
LFGIAITELTGHISRRTLYCSKDASSDYTVSKFDNPDGNIRYKATEHTWKDGKCIYCGTSQQSFEGRTNQGLESHAYEFIHTKHVEALLNMKFDVIIGNPPYQMGDSGAFASAKPIYNKFVEQSKKLNPKYLCMIIPARWYAGGKGLDEFRENMLSDNHIRVLHDYPIGEDCFPGIRIAGGVCYFIWDRDYIGECEVYSHKGNAAPSYMKRSLLEPGSNTFIRINEAVSIYRKVHNFHETPFSSIVSARKPFGLPSDFINSPNKYNLPNISESKFDNCITIIGTYKYKTTERYVAPDYPFPNGHNLIGKWKVFVSQVLDNGFDWTKERLNPFIGKPNTACTETFLTVGGYDNEKTAQNVISYMNTKFFHMLMFLKKVSHHVVSKVYEYVPMQDFSKPWTDEELYEKYGLTQEEIDFIESMIKPME